MLSLVRGLLISCVFGFVAAIASCSEKSDPPQPPLTALTKEQLLDPESCRRCHVDHYKQWSGSMHAYA